MIKSNTKKANEKRIRSAATAKTWDDNEVRLKRQTRHSCTVTINGITTEHRSVRAGFEAYGLPDGKHIPFRIKAKNEGVAIFSYEGKSYEFKTFTKDDSTTSEVKKSLNKIPKGTKNSKQAETTIDEQLTTVYEVMMHAAKTDTFNATNVRAIYSHIIGPKLKMHLRRFTGKVSRAAAADPEAKLILEHFLRIQHNLTEIIKNHIENGPNTLAFIEAVRHMEQVHIVTSKENYAALKAKGCYEKAGIELLNWNDLPEHVRQILYKRKLHGEVSNAKLFSS